MYIVARDREVEELAMMKEEGFKIDLAFEVELELEKIAPSDE